MLNLLSSVIGNSMSERVADQERDSNTQAKWVATCKSLFTRYLSEARRLMATDDNESKVFELQRVIADARDTVVTETYTLADILTTEKKYEEANEREEDLTTIEDQVETINEEISVYMKERIKASQEMAVSLQPLCLPTFSGKDYFHWRAIFDVAVHSQVMPKRFKMVRLLSCLEGEPKELFAHYPLTAKSYDRALERLEELYGGQSMLIGETIQNMHGKVVDEANLGEVSSFLALLRATAITLKVINGQSDLSEGNALFELAKDQMSRVFLREYTDWTAFRSTNRSFESLIHFLTEWSQIMNCASTWSQANQMEPLAIYPTVDQSRKNFNFKDKRFVFRPFCPWHRSKFNVSELHYLDVCVDFKAMNVKDRRDFVNGNKLCRMCLKSNHIANDCNNERGRCKMCPNSKHHFLLHENSAKTMIHGDQGSNVEAMENLKVQQLSLDMIPVKESLTEKKTLTVNGI